MIEKDKSIGIYDSGLGGLSVFKELFSKLKNENYIYFGDTKNLPYGDKKEEELLKIATNEVYEDNRKEKHSKDAKYGWYSYDSRFALPVFGDDGEIERYNVFNVAMLVRHDEDGKYYLYDIMKIKKKRAIFSSQMTLLSNKTHFLII